MLMPEPPQKPDANSPLFKNLRLYCFVNGLYLSSLQKGLQTAHVVSELHSKYGTNSEIYNQWASNHKTIIILDGTNHETVKKISGAISEFGKSLRLPYATFQEDEASLNCAYTATGIIMPEYLYTKPKQVDAEPDVGSFFYYLKNAKLAS